MKSVENGIKEICASLVRNAKFIEEQIKKLEKQKMTLEELGYKFYKKTNNAVIYCRDYPKGTRMIIVSRKRKHKCIVNTFSRDVQTSREGFLTKEEVQSCKLERRRRW